MEYSGNNTKKVPDIYSEFLTFFGFGCFSIGITPALIDFEQGSEVRVIVLDTMIFHPRHNEKIDPRFGHIVVVFHRLAGEGWNNDRDCSVLWYRRRRQIGLLLKVCLDYSGLL